MSNAYSPEVMQRIEALDRNCEQNKILNLSPAFYERVLTVALGSISSFSGAAIAVSAAYGFTATVIAAPAAVILLGAGGAFFWVSTKILDYNDPQQLKKFRNEAGKIYEDIQFGLENNILDSIQDLEEIGTSLFDTIEEMHGLENMFYYGIPLPEDFEKMYRVQLEFLDINSWLRFHKKVALAYQEAKAKYGDNVFEYSILDHQRWPEDLKRQLNQKWKNELLQYYDPEKGYSIRKIFNNYNFSVLQEYKVIDQDESEFFCRLNNDYQDNQKNLQNLGGEHYTEFKNILMPHKYLKEREIWRGTKEYRNHPAHQKLEEVTWVILEEIHEIRKERDRAIQPILQRYKNYENGMTNCGTVAIENLPETLQVNLEREKRRAEEEIATVMQEFSGPIREIKRKYVYLREKHIEQLQRSKQKKEIMIQEAHERYREKKDEVMPRFRDILRGPLQQYDFTNQRIKEAFSNFLQ